MMQYSEKARSTFPTRLTRTTADRSPRPHIAIAIGDPAGIGPEVTLKALAHSAHTHDCNITVVGSRTVLQQTYDRLLTLGLALAKAGYSVILDAKYDRQALRQHALEQIQAAGLPLTILHCTAPPAVLEARIRDRSGDIADATVAVLQRQHMEPFTPTEQAWVRAIDTTQAMPPQIAAIVGAQGAA